jgi:hypothetical protein
MGYKGVLTGYSKGTHRLLTGYSRGTQGCTLQLLCGADGSLTRAALSAAVAAAAGRPASGNPGSSDALTDDTWRALTGGRAKGPVSTLGVLTGDLRGLIGYSSGTHRVLIGDSRGVRVR